MQTIPAGIQKRKNEGNKVLKNTSDTDKRCSIHLTGVQEERIGGNNI
jgi:hypothetical protein